VGVENGVNVGNGLAVTVGDGVSVREAVGVTVGIAACVCACAVTVSATDVPIIASTSAALGPDGVVGWGMQAVNTRMTNSKNRFISASFWLKTESHHLFGHDLRDIFHLHRIPIRF
jgi:hypothetical protein